MWGLIAFVIGLVYGWASPGRQNKMSMFRTGLLVGLVLALVLALIGFVTGSDPLGVGLGAGMLAIVINVLVITLLFILGVWLGDLIEGSRARRRTI